MFLCPCRSREWGNGESWILQLRSGWLIVQHGPVEVFFSHFPLLCFVFLSNKTRKWTRRQIRSYFSLTWSHLSWLLPEWKPKALMKFVGLLDFYLAKFFPLIYCIGNADGGKSPRGETGKLDVHKSSEDDFSPVRERKKRGHSTPSDPVEYLCQKRKEGKKAKNQQTQHEAGEFANNFSSPKAAKGCGGVEQHTTKPFFFTWM